MVAVTLNYRLSALGFLQGYADAGNGSSLDAGINWGPRDQRLALHWIQKNIYAFERQYWHRERMISPILIM